MHLCRIRTHLNFCHRNCVFAFIQYYWIPNPKHDKSAFLGQVYFIFVSQILHFETQIALRFVPVASTAVHVSPRRAHGMSDKQFVYYFFYLKSLLRGAVYKK